MIIFITLDILIRYTHMYIFIPVCIFIPTYNKRAISTKLSPTRASSGFFINFMSCSFLQPINHIPTPKSQTLHEKIICIYLWKLSTHETLCCLSPSYPLVTKWIIRYYSRKAWAHLWQSDRACKNFCWCENIADRLPDSVSHSVLVIL